MSAFLQQSNAVLTHDVESQLERIAAPTLITFGRDDVLTSARFATRLAATIRRSEVVVFDGCSHAPLYEKVQEFNAQTLAFLRRPAVAGVAS